MHRKAKKKAASAALLAPPAKGLGRRGYWLALGAIATAAVVVLFGLTRQQAGKRVTGQTNVVGLSGATQTVAIATAAVPVLASNAVARTNPVPSVAVNTALMVTVELDFGPSVPSIAEALGQVERRYQPEDGRGRTFAVLDAYGEPTPQGKLHLSMHLSMEKPGRGALIFRRTGQTLWQSQIVQGTNAAQFTGKNLTLYLDDGAGKVVAVDGSKNPATIMEATIKEAGVPVSLFWPDGAEREMTFLYSACGCPVKVMVRRTGDKTMRTKDLPVIFPDDPAVVALIAQLMGW